MKILYGIQTTGNGHIVRSREMIRALRQAGHEVCTILSGSNHKNVWDQSIFEPFECKKGLTFVTQSGKIKYLQTVCQLNLFRFYKDIFSYRPKDIDLIITDYEPLTARIAKRNRIPSIGIGHLYAFSHKIPEAKSSVLSRMIMKSFAPADIPLGLHWHHFNQSILPPTIPKDITPGSELIANKILVYLPFESIKAIKEFLRPFKDYNFHIYCSIDTPRQDEQLSLKPLSRENFVKDLQDAGGVICNSGFSLLSEALHLKKKILTKPVSGQVEQESNALALEELKLGTVCKKLDQALTATWLESDQQAGMNFPDVIQDIVDWIDSGQLDSVPELVREVWNKVG
jgi:uncharacterized protein (TIGR00661 family)